jgi:hypothetical protein
MPHNPVNHQCVRPLAAIAFIPVLANANSRVSAWRMEIKPSAGVTYDTGTARASPFQTRDSFLQETRLSRGRRPFPATGFDPQDFLGTPGQNPVNPVIPSKRFVLVPFVTVFSN